MHLEPSRTNWNSFFIALTFFGQSKCRILLSLISVRWWLIQIFDSDKLPKKDKETNGTPCIKTWNLSDILVKIFAILNKGIKKTCLIYIYHFVFTFIRHWSSHCLTCIKYDSKGIEYNSTEDCSILDQGLIHYTCKIFRKTNISYPLIRTRIFQIVSWSQKDKPLWHIHQMRIKNPAKHRKWSILRK